MTKSTVKDNLEAARQELAAPRTKLIRKIEILEMLPPDLAAPTISNAVRTQESALEPSAWLSFSDREYGQGNYSPVEILQALEAAGWKTSPATLVRKADYRRSSVIGTCDDMPEKIGRDEVTDVSPICPLWIEPRTAHYNTGEAKCFMIAPSGEVFRVSVDLPANPAMVRARRIDGRGDWRYDRNSASLAFPPTWEVIDDNNGEGIAHRHNYSFAAVDDAQALSGMIYWEPIAHEQDAFPLTASEMLAKLLEPTATKND